MVIYKLKKKKKRKSSIVDHFYGFEFIAISDFRIVKISSNFIKAMVLCELSDKSSSERFILELSKNLLS